MLFDGYEKIAHISNWTDPAETASCKFVADQPGRYQVSVTYCSDRNRRRFHRHFEFQR